MQNKCFNDIFIVTAALILFVVTFITLLLQKMFSG